MHPAMIPIILTKPVIVQDSFDRADNASGLGVAETGQVWENLSATMGVTSKKAIHTAATNVVFGNSAAHIETGSLNIKGSVDLTFDSNTTNSASLIFRSIDMANHMRLRIDGSTIKITKLIAGEQSVLGEYTYAWINGITHNLGILAFGNTFIAYLDNILILTVIDDNATKTGTKAGMWGYSLTNIPAALWDNFKVEEI